MSDRVVVPRMLSRAPTMWLSVAVTVVGFVAVTGYYAMDPSTRVPTIIGAALVVAFFTILLSRRVVIDTRAGTVTREMLGFLRKTATWDQAKLQTTYTGQRLLSVGASHIPLAADDMGGRRSQPPEFLELLADQLEQWAPEKEKIARELREFATLLRG